MSTAVVSSTLLEESEEESEVEEEDIDFDKSIRIEASVNHMDKKRKFLEKYIKIKIIQLRDLLQSSRTLGYEVPDSNSKAQRGTKTTQIKIKSSQFKKTVRKNQKKWKRRLMSLQKRSVYFY